MGLFGGKTETQPSRTRTGSAGSGLGSSSQATGRHQPDASPSATSEAPTVIGVDTVVTGQVESKTDMLIEGRVEGQLTGARRVIIGERGDVNAKVRADVVTVRGTVNGDLEGTTKVEITSTGKVFGNITSKAIVVAEGATFRGSSKMAKTPAEPARTPAEPGKQRATPTPGAASPQAPSSPSRPS